MSMMGVRVGVRSGDSRHQKWQEGDEGACAHDGRCVVVSRSL
jgi:hypothetical protein